MIYKTTANGIHYIGNEWAFILEDFEADFMKLKINKKDTTTINNNNPPLEDRIVKPAIDDITRGLYLEVKKVTVEWPVYFKKSSIYTLCSYINNVKIDEQYFNLMIKIKNKLPLAKISIHSESNRKLIILHNDDVIFMGAMPIV